MVREAASKSDRHSKDPKSSVRAPAKKQGGGGKFTLGKDGDYSGGATVDSKDPNYDPDEKRIDPDDGQAYTFSALSLFYKGKYNKQACAEYWEYECTAVKRKGKARSKEAAPAGPTLAESVAQVRPKAKVKAKAKPDLEPRLPRRERQERLTDEDLEPNGPLAAKIAAVIPYFPYKKVDKFYDIQGLLNHPKLLNSMCEVMARRFRKLGITKIAAFEARGFLFTPVAIKLGVPFLMLRKAGKMPNTISSAPYTKEYEGVDTICVQKGAIVKGDKVALIDDLVATGGTLCAGIELVKACEAEVTECTCMVEIKFLKGRDRCIAAGAKDVWGFIPEDLLTTAAELPADYTDDGAAH